MENEIQLPGYVERAITSRTARTEPYNWLNEQEWRDVAEHVYQDEIVPVKATGKPFLVRGTQNSYGHGRRRTLNGILWSAVPDHANVSDLVPHYGKAERVFEVIRAAEEITEDSGVVLVDRVANSSPLQ